MALPKWITPAGVLGVIPNLEYYTFPLDAYDASGGDLTYKLISGRLPLGLQIVNSSSSPGFTAGMIQGIPVSELDGEQTVDYKFTVRVQNTVTKSLADRTFTISITNVAPPIITPKNVFLGNFADGSVFNRQLTAFEYTPGADLRWSVKSGELPDGLSLSTDGILSGYIHPIPQPNPALAPSWDMSFWSNEGWEFTPKAINKMFTFTVEVFDGVYYDVSTYTLQVYPRSLLSVDSTIITVDATVLSNGQPFTIASGDKHIPIILTEQSDLVPVRQGSYFSFNIDAVDLDGAQLQYIIPSSGEGGWDEQILIGPGVPYISTHLVGNLLQAGVWPHSTISSINGIDTVVNDYTRPNLVEGDIVKVLDSTDMWRNVVVTNETTVKLTGNGKVVANVGQFITQPTSTANATISNVGPTVGTLLLTNGNITANIGATITQVSTGANAIVTSNVVNAVTIPIQYVSGEFNTSNITLNGTALGVNPVSAPIVTTEITAAYNTAATFDLNLSDSSAYAYISSANTKSIPTSITSVGVTTGAPSIEGTVGWDETKYDQSILNLPDGLSIDINTGWLTGHLPTQTVDELVVGFEVVVYKKDDPTYFASKLYTLTILGDLNDTIEWKTPSDLGTIQNGKVSDLFVEAVSAKGKTLQYALKSGAANRLPQGLTIGLSGLISGRVSFEMFSLDQNDVTIDGGTTTFDNTYTFTVTAYDTNRTIDEDRTFTIRVLNRNKIPYENLYLKAVPSLTQRAYFQSIMQNRTVFPADLIYRNDDPNFGLAQEIRTLFLPGLEPSTLAEYAAAVDTNHFDKRLTFGEVKSAVVLDSTFNVKYEVVYVELLDTNTNALGQGPANSTDLSNEIANPYYDQDGNPYTTIYPNSFTNMKDSVADYIGYANKGALPDWMTSKQPNGRVLGFTRAVVLAHTVPGAGNLVAYRFAQANFNLNQIDFTVDRYLLDNNYSTNFDIATGRFLKSSETTFDRYPGLTSVFRPFGTVDYAVSNSYESINNRTVSDIIAAGGLDGIKTFKNGETLVFAEQEFFNNINDIGEYNRGWSDIQDLWSADGWQYDSNLTDVNNPGGDPTPSNTWDTAGYISGYNEHLLDPVIPNKRIGVWRINIAADNIVTLTSTITSNVYSGTGIKREFLITDPFAASISVYVNHELKIKDLDYVITNNILTFSTAPAAGVDNIVVSYNELNYFNTLYVRNGFTYGGTNIYYDSLIKPNRLIANWSIIPQFVRSELNATRFDGNGTRFFDNRDSYELPFSNDKYIKFANTNVFN